MGGGQYDNMRMSIASSGGVKGGAIADIYFVTRFRFNRKYALTFNLPILLPIIYSTAFSMLQFNPEFRFEMKSTITESLDLIHGPILGANFHYGADYTSDYITRSANFFAAGPSIGYFCGIGFYIPGNYYSILAIRVFYSPLITLEGSVGTVIGGALEYTFYF